MVERVAQTSPLHPFALPILHLLGICVIASIRETCIAQSDLKLLDRIRDHAGIEPAKSTMLLFTQQR